MRSLLLLLLHGNHAAQGPVSCSKLMMLLVNIKRFIKISNMNITNTLLFFGAIQRILTFFQQKIAVYLLLKSIYS